VSARCCAGWPAQAPSVRNGTDTNAVIRTSQEVTFTRNPAEI
jgi:hypothetical protein